ncbi:MAG: hypothetical protein ACQEQ0_13505, partial [Bacteroidota bacterium]
MLLKRASWNIFDEGTKSQWMGSALEKTDWDVERKVNPGCDRFTEAKFYICQTGTPAGNGPGNRLHS